MEKEINSAVYQIKRHNLIWRGKVRQSEGKGEGRVRRKWKGCGGEGKGREGEMQRVR